MNTWMSNTFAYPEVPLDRGKLLDDATLKRLGEWGRYRDVDGDGIPYRTIPGTGGPAYFTRGSGHNEKGQYSERPDEYVHNMERLARKFETARNYVPKPILAGDLDSDIAIVGYGSSHYAIEESRDQLLREVGASTAYMRLRAYPFTEELEAFIDHHQRIYVVEQNRDGQMLSLMRLALSAERGAKLRKVLHYNGLPIDARSITDEILAQEGIARPTHVPIGADSRRSRAGVYRTHPPASSNIYRIVVGRARQPLFPARDRRVMGEREDRVPGTGSCLAVLRDDQDLRGTGDVSGTARISLRS